MSVNRIFRSFFGKPNSRHSNRRSSAGASLALREVRVEPLEDRRLLAITPTISVTPIQVASGERLNNFMIQATATATVNDVTVIVPGTFAFVTDDLFVRAPGIEPYRLNFTPVDTVTYSPVRVNAPVTVLSPPDLATTSPQILGPTSTVLTGVVSPGNSLSETYFQYTAGPDFTPSDTSTIASGLINPSAITVDLQGNVYVAETGNDAVRVIPADGSSIKTVGSGFKAPTKVAVDVAGNVFVDDTGNGLIKQIFKDGTILTLPSGYGFPTGPVQDRAGDLYELDKADGSVRKRSIPRIPLGTLSPQETPISLTHTLTGLTTGATYKYRLVARNRDGIAPGQTISFIAGRQPDSLSNTYSIRGGGGSQLIPRGILPLSSTPITINGEPALAIAGPSGNPLGFPSLGILMIDPQAGLLTKIGPFAFAENEFAISDMTTADFDGDGAPDIAVTGEFLNVFMSNQNTYSDLPTMLNVSFGQTLSVTTGDLNGDGRPEILVSGVGGGIDIFVNRGNGTFDNAIYFPGSVDATSLSLADINRDGNLDLITTEDNSIGIYTGKGDATFNARGSVGLATDASGVTIVDLNEDQYPDIAITSIGSSTVTLLTNNGAGAFTSVATFPVGVNPFDVKLGDVTGDGTLDLVVANRGTESQQGSVNLFIGLGSMSYASGVSLGYQFRQNDNLVTSVSDVPLLGMQLIDFSQTGHAEIVMLSTMGIATITYNGPQFFDSPIVPVGVIAGPGTFSQTMRTADVNSDGLLDVLAVYDGELVLSLNRGNGRFQTDRLGTVGKFVRDILVTDANGDGNQDLYFQASGRIRLLLNDGNEHFTFSALYANFSGPEGNLNLSDVNADGLSDLVTFGPGGVVAFLNHGEGIYGRKLQDNPVIYVPDSVVINIPSGIYRGIADLNADGRDDFVWTTLGTETSPGAIVRIDLSNTTGGYVSTQWQLPDFLDSKSLSAIPPLVTDLDGDGDIDFAVRGSVGRNLFIYRNNGDGSFMAPSLYTLRSDILTMAAGDFNGDGGVDIAVARKGPTVITGSGHPVEPGNTSLTLLSSDGHNSFAIGDVGNIIGFGQISESLPTFVSGRFESSDKDSLFTHNGLLRMITPAITLDQVNLPRQVAAGTSVGDITASTTGLGDITYRLVSGEGDTDNALFSLDSNGRLTTTAALDASVKSSYSIRVKSIDSVGVIGEQVISVALKSVSLTNVVSTLQDTTSTAARTRVADIGISAVSSSVNSLSLSGPDAAVFEIADGQLFLKAGVKLGVAKLSYNVTVNLDDPSLNGSPDATVNYTLNITSFIPTNLSVSTPTIDMTPTLTWSPGVDALRYEVYVKNLVTKQVIRQTVADTSWTPSAELGIARYQFWARSINAANVRSAWSLPTSFVVNTPVTIPAQTVGRTLRPQINWTALPGAVSYEIWLTDSSRNSPPLIRQSGVTSASWSPSSDLALGRYRIWVRGIDASGRAARWSTGLPFTVSAAPVPDDALASTFSRTPTLNWTAAAGSATFELLLVNQSTGTRQTIPGITSNHWTPTTALTDGRWTWRVRATSIFGNITPWSETAILNVGGTTIVSQPIVSSGLPAEFRWSAVSGAASYTLWLNRIDEQQAVLRLDGLTSNSYTTATPLTAGVYRIWIRAVSTSGEVARWSRLMEFTVAGTAVPQVPGLRDSLLRWQWASLDMPSDSPADPAEGEATADANAHELQHQVRQIAEPRNVRANERANVTVPPEVLRLAETINQSECELSQLAHGVDTVFAESLAAILESTIR